ncbi:AI-2E family transporter [Ferruginibacter sp. HRS2-29]|uniref:AI-2E family transporter n=1 Tax=Ferruginibacter sp. HRS2-29 TaxID=2487334 RepID=UPI0020CF6A87|nr:AI-2E family transporter [Ferruginibacter sp. HRS2-29]MCP9752966.1 AI-2E family transporter [Ferruginibacter sp. HRS2-29]
MTQQIFNDRIRQIVLLTFIILLGWVLLTKMTSFLPGLLGGITLYILSRTWFFKLIFKRKWKKGWTAFLFMMMYIVIIAIPIYFAVTMISPKVSALINNQEQIMTNLQTFSEKVKAATGIQILSEENTKNLSQKIASFIPSVINSTANILTNLIMMFFLFYYLLVSGRDVEKKMGQLIPLKPNNINTLASESRMMIKANALGIPVICIIQGLTAALGYFIFGVKDWGMWGFVTGVFAFFPIVGTMIVWVPLVIVMFSTQQTGPAIGLTIYSVVVTGNVDYLSRITLLKRMGNVHPMITVLGVIVGLNLFGFIGLIFGPLLVSYFLILVKIYINEFSASGEVITDMKTNEEEETMEKKKSS